MSDVEATIGASIDDLKKAVKAASATLDKYADDARKSGKKAGEGFQREFGDQVSGIGKKLLAALSVGAVVQQFGAALQSGANLVELSNTLNLATDDVEGLRYAFAELGNQSQDTADRGVKFLAKGISEARQGTGALLPFLRELGIAYDDLGDKTTVDIIKDIADASKDIEEPELLGLALKTAGEEGASFVSVLRAGGDEIQRLVNEAPKVGDAYAQSLAQAEAASRKFGESVTAARNQVVAALLETPQFFSDFYDEVIKGGSDDYLPSNRSRAERRENRERQAAEREERERIAQEEEAARKAEFQATRTRFLTEVKDAGLDKIISEEKFARQTPEEQLATSQARFKELLSELNVLDENDSEESVKAALAELATVTRQMRTLQSQIDRGAAGEEKAGPESDAKGFAVGGGVAGLVSQIFGGPSGVLIATSEKQLRELEKANASLAQLVRGDKSPRQSLVASTGVLRFK